VLASQACNRSGQHGFASRALANLACNLGCQVISGGTAHLLQDRIHLALGTGGIAFRRGLATNLREMEILDDVIQRILRHGDVATAQRHYAKTLPISVSKAMAKLDRKLKAG
jgi:integrase